MIVDIYCSNSQPGKYVAVKAGQDITDPIVGITDPDFAKVTPFKKGVSLEPEIIGIDPVQAETDINAKNHHITGTAVRISVDIKPME